MKKVLNGGVNASSIGANNVKGLSDGFKNISIIAEPAICRNKKNEGKHQACYIRSYLYADLKKSKFSSA